VAGVFLKTSQTLQIEQQSSSWKLWLLIIFLSVLWHCLWLWLQPNWHHKTSPPRIEIQRIDPQKLEAIRKQLNSKQLLISKNKSNTSELEAPADARFISDRNIRVKKEQRASQTQVLPRSGNSASKAEQSISQKLTLEKLGVPIPLPPNAAQRAKLPRRQLETNPGGDQAILDRRLPEGSENLLNAQESVYYSFYARIYAAIAPIWESRVHQVPYRRRLQAGDYSTAVDVILDRYGNLLGVLQEKSSGVPDFDDAVQRSWRKIGRFPNPPHGLLDKNGQVHLGWVFTVQVGSGFKLHYLPPEQAY
jgi:outer membrane biosynthesis protein TonB